MLTCSTRNMYHTCSLSTFDYYKIVHFEIDREGEMRDWEISIRHVIGGTTDILGNFVEIFFFIIYWKNKKLWTIWERQWKLYSFMIIKRLRNLTSYFLYKKKPNNRRTRFNKKTHDTIISSRYSDTIALDIVLYNSFHIFQCSWLGCT